MRNQTTYHEVGGYVIEVRPDGPGRLHAATMEHGTTITLRVDENGSVEGPTFISGVKESQKSELNVGSPESIEAMQEAIRQRRSGEVIPEDLPPDWLPE